MQTERSLLERKNLSIFDIKSIIAQNRSRNTLFKYISNVELVDIIEEEQTILIDVLYTEQPNFIAEHMQFIFPIDFVVSLTNNNKLKDKEMIINELEYISNNITNDILFYLTAIRNQTIPGISYSNKSVINCFNFHSGINLLQFLNKTNAVKLNCKLLENKDSCFYINIPSENFEEQDINNLETLKENMKYFV